MLNLFQYRRTADRLTDHLPWAALVARGVILNKDGSLQRTFRYRGPDIESATPEELVGVCARLNNALRRFGSGWAFCFEALRAPAHSYPDTGAERGLARLIEAERRAAFEGELAHTFETTYYLTLTCLPEADQTDSLNAAMIETSRTVGGRDWHDAIGRFVRRTDACLDLLAGCFAQIDPLDDAATLTYLHACVSTKAHPVAVPETPVYLDAILADMPLSGGVAPRLGDDWLRTLTVQGFPNHTVPGLLDHLNQLDLPYRWVTRFIPLDKTAAVASLTRLRRQWFAKRKSVTAILREVMYAQESRLVDTDADNKMLDADAALQAVGADQVSFGYLTTTVTVSHPERSVADDRLRQVEQVINGLGFTTIDESLNAVEAWLGSLPGHLYANIRQPLIHSLNLVHLMPMSSVWAGEVRDGHLDGPPLFHALSSGATPFRFNLHVGDVGHTLIVGPTGAGKSVLLSFMALQFQRYPEAQVFIFDKGASARAVTLALGGSHYPLGREAGLAFQPLRRIDDVTERGWALDWLILLLTQENVAITPEIKETLWSALSSLSQAPVSERTLTGLVMLLASNAVKQALQPYTLDGVFGQCLDSDDERLDLSACVCFETEELMAAPNLMAPVLTYLFHQLDARFDGRPTLLILDEAWVFLDNPLFAARIREWLKVLRKRNVSVVFATQSLADIIDSAVAPAVIESCPQRLFLPNLRATELQSRAAYEALGLNARQIELIGQATPKRHYYLQSRQGNRLFDLNLGPLALAICTASSPADQALIDRLWAEHGADGFASALLNARGPAWAKDLLPAFDSAKVSSVTA
ncbi:conjugal transfer protein TrbE [Asticcacaulis taihuensis]|uniref:Type IV secretion system protein VirB4 n=1 Tax=Asticcacaulis taihuensis TaxID=260084 RepID=A0A1G4PU73_9CAUL|nr:conjugal transfer protein TrbE [Asticcacaulis taihuensis]SCW35721.1 type IV secretion system protein VirB4 [Asticcacaulis taihuensis]